MKTTDQSDREILEKQVRDALEKYLKAVLDLVQPDKIPLKAKPKRGGRR